MKHCPEENFVQLAEAISRIEDHIGLKTSTDDITVNGRLSKIKLGAPFKVAEFDGSPDAVVNKIVFNGSSEIVYIQDDVAYININPYKYSRFGESDGTLPCDIIMSDLFNWSVSSPTTEGSPFKIGDWTPGSVVPCTNSNVSVSHSNKARIKINSVFTCELYDSDNTLISSNTISNLNGNVTLNSNGILLQVAGWEADGNMFAAVFSADIDILNILSTSNRVYLKILVGEEEVSSQDFFFDNNSTTCSVSVPSISESEPAGAVINYISGVGGYAVNSKFSTSISNINTPNGDMFKSVGIVEIDGSSYNLNTLYISGSDLTGWSTLYDVSNCSYNNNLWTVLNENIFLIDDNAKIRSRGCDPWSNQTWVESQSSKIIINTYTPVSTSTYEDFRDEVWRLPFDSYDIPLGINEEAWKNKWDSSLHLTDNDLQCYFNGGWCLMYPTKNFVGYAPLNNLQPNYSSLIGRRYYTRSFFNNSMTNAIQGSVRLHGVAKTDLNTSLGNGLRVEIKVPSRTGWLDLGRDFDNGLFSGVDGDGIWQNRSAQGNDWFDFGWNVSGAVSSSTGWAIVLRISAEDSGTKLPTAVTFQFNLQEHN